MPLVLWLCHGPTEPPLTTLPRCPASGLRLWGEKQLAWPPSRWRAGAHLVFSLMLCNTHTHAHTVAHSSFCTLRFNQALSWASVTALSARRVKDLSPQVTSLTDLQTDRPLAHLLVDVTALSAWFEEPLWTAEMTAKSFEFILFLFGNKEKKKKTTRRCKGAIVLHATVQKGHTLY